MLLLACCASEDAPPPQPDAELSSLLLQRARRPHPSWWPADAEPSWAAPGAAFAPSPGGAAAGAPPPPPLPPLSGRARKVAALRGGCAPNTAADACRYVRSAPACRSSGRVQYLELHFCRFVPRAGRLGVLSTLLPLLALCLWLLALFTCLSVAAERYFAPAVSRLADAARLSDDVSGATLLALGNGAPDFFTQLAALTGSALPDTQLALGEGLGAGVYVSLFCLALSVVVADCPCPVALGPFSRDVGFLIAVLITLSAAGARGTAGGGVAAALLLLYCGYVCCVVAGHRVCPRLLARAPPTPLSLNGGSRRVDDDAACVQLAERGGGGGGGCDEEEGRRKAVPPVAISLRAGGGGGNASPHAPPEDAPAGGGARVGSPPRAHRAPPSPPLPPPPPPPPPPPVSPPPVVSWLASHSGWHDAARSGSRLQLLLFPITGGVKLALAATMVEPQDERGDHDTDAHPHADEGSTCGAFSAAAPPSPQPHPTPPPQPPPAAHATRLHIFLVLCFLPPLLLTVGGVAVLSLPRWLLALRFCGSALLASRLPRGGVPIAKALWPHALSFAGGLAWMDVAADELVAAFQAVGRIAGLPEALLGGTLMCWAASVGDLAGMLALTRRGRLPMVITSCFAGPLFQLAAGVGASLAVVSARNASASRPPARLALGDDLVLMLSFFLCALVYLLLATPTLHGGRLTPRLARGLAAAYAGFVVVYSSLDVEESKMSA